MSKLIRFKPLTALAITGMTVSLLTTACGEDNPLSDAAGALCCESFSVGADMSDAEFGLEGDIQGQFRAFAQAASDLSVVANGAMIDVSVACEAIARDLGASDEDVDAELAKAPEDSVTGLCALATAQIEAKFGASGELNATLAVDFQPPVCTASVEAAASCQGGCSADAECDLEANPPTCDGGKLTVECSGTCMGSADAAVSCTGTCSGSCEGSCTAEAGATVACEGTCEGECTAAGNANQSGVQADGTCMGNCSGKCTAKAGVMVECMGTCEGKCDAACEAKADVKFTCDGECMGEFEAPKCEGGELKVDCNVDAECKANCEASASAKAECHPPSIAIVATGSGTANVDAAVQIEAAIASLKANLPALLVVFEARGEAFAAGIKASLDAGKEIALDVGDLSGEAAFCAPAIVGAITDASANFAASFEASGEVVLAVTGS
jgi:hypothetical protein